MVDFCYKTWKKYFHHGLSKVYRIKKAGKATRVVLLFRYSGVYTRDPFGLSVLLTKTLKDL